MLRLGLVVFACLIGCGASHSAVAKPRAELGRASGQVRLEGKVAAQDRRIHELEGRLALMESEAREIRAELAEFREHQKQRTVRIGGRIPSDLDAESDPVVRVRERSDGPRPILRLYGAPRPMDGAPLPPSPSLAGLNEKLPVVPLPGASAKSVAGTMPEGAGDGVAEYKAALALFQKRDFRGAWEAFSAFAGQRASHPLALNAAYWQGECSYALKNYSQAAAEFERVLHSAPRGSKAPDALFKLSLSYERMGRSDRARAYIARLQQEFPKSVPARLASEGKPL